MSNDKHNEYKIIAKSKYFNKKWYLNRYVDVARKGVDPIKHYLEYGWKEGRNPGPNFDTNGYLKRYKECKVNPLVHFETFGRKKKYEVGAYINEKVNNKYWKEHDKLKHINKVVYSCMTGAYDDVITDFFPKPDYDYILFTDNKKLLRKKKVLWWQVKPLAFVADDPIRSARWHKTHPHILFPEYKYSVWIDSNVQIKGSAIYSMIEKHIKLRHKIAISLHPFRNCIYDEANACILSGKDNPTLINKQMDILKKDGYPSHNGLYETNVLLRKHMEPQIIFLCETWWWFIRNFSRRDQLSFNYLLWKKSIKHYPIDKKSLRFHPEFNLICHNYKPAVTKYKTNKILVHLHLYYHEQLDWFLEKLKNITYDYDLWVTVTTSNQNTENKIKRFKSDANILLVPNRGYDIYPFWQVLQHIKLSDYDAVLKIHTKNYRTKMWSNNNISYMGFEWRNDLIEPLIGNKLLFWRSMKILCEKGVGMVGSNNLIGNQENILQQKNTKQMCNRIGIKYFDKCPFICGTMFMIRPDLLSKFKEYRFKLSDFSLESQTGSTGSTAHSLETLLGLLVFDRGLKVKGVNNFKTFCKKIKNLCKEKYINIVRKKYEKDVDYIKHSKYFDKKWYLRKYPDVAESKINPAKHFFIYGWKEGRLPGPKFNVRFYLDNNLDVKRAKINPLLHYEKHGKYEGRVFSDKIKKYPINVKEFCDSYPKCKTNFTEVMPQIIVSFTSFPGRINIVHKAIETLKNQSVKPDKIILYLSEEEFPDKYKQLPKTLKNMLDNVFTIHWVKETLYSFQKIVPALEEYPDAIIITADDDVLYNKDWLELLLKAYINNPYMIHCHRAHRICFNKKYLKSYNLWNMVIRNESAAFCNFLTGVGGVLYPPHCLDANITNKKEFLSLCPKADDIWIWAMAVKNNMKIHVIKDNMPVLRLVPGSQDGDCLCKINTGEVCYNDVQLKNVLDKYPEILNKILKERRINTLKAWIFYPYYLLKFYRIITNNRDIN